MSVVADATAQGTAFTYQGRLSVNGGTTNGTYDLRCTIYDSATSGNAIAGPLTNLNVAVSDGLFTTLLDFGAGAFTGPARWLEIGVRTNGSSDDFMTLSPRQSVTPTPYALFAGEAGLLAGNASQTFTGPIAFNPSATGAPPFTVGSSNMVANLNADLLDGLHATNFLLKSERCVTNIAELKAHNPGFVPCVTVLGYYAPADGGGGDFCWDPSANVNLAQFPTGEDGGTVIKPNSLPPSVAGRWRRSQGPPLNVRWFGARGNGLDDDSAVIQNAINAALAGGAVYFPTGTYHVAFELVLNNATNFALTGDGPPSCLDFDVPDAGLLGVDVGRAEVRDLRLSGASGRTILFASSSEITVRHCTISGATRPAYLGTAAVVLYGVTDGAVESCRFNGNGFGASDTNSSLCIHVTLSSRVKILHNTCISTATTMGIGVEDSTNVTVLGNYISGALAKPDGSAWGYGAYFYQSGSNPPDTSYNICAENQIHGTGGPGIYVQGSPYTAVRGNLVQDTCRTITGSSLALAGIALNAPAHHCVVSDNIVLTTGNSQPYPGIRFDAPKTRVLGNVISNTAGDGILYVGECSDSIISGNTVVNAGGAGITPYLASTATNLVINGNIIDGTGGLQSGIACAGPTGGSNIDAHVLVTANVVRNAGGYGIVISSLNRFLVANNLVTDSSAGTNNVYSGIYLALTQDGVVSGNQSHNTGPAGQAYGIQVAGGSTLEVLNNNVHNNQSGGISVGGASGVTLSGNRWSSAPGEGRVPLGSGACGTGCAVVTTAEFQPGDAVILSNVGSGGVPGVLSVDTSTAGQFVIRSSSASDSSAVYWKIIH